MITAEEFKNKMMEIAIPGDPEIAHQMADVLLCRTLRELGYCEGIDIFEKIDKYYS